MKNGKICRSVALVLSGALGVAGCSSPNKDGTIINPINVAGQLGSFDVLANIPTQKSGTISNSLTDEVSGGTISIDPSDVTVTPKSNPSGKLSTALLEGDRTVSVIVYVASDANKATVCGGANSDSYGPFNVTLDADNKVTKIEPNSVVLTQRTIDIINSAKTSVCVQVTANFNATVTIEEFTFTLTKAQVQDAADGTLTTDDFGLFDGLTSEEVDGLSEFKAVTPRP